MIQKGSLEVRPSAIVFRDLECGEKDSIDVWARNAGKRPVHVRFSLPENNPAFSLVCKANIMTAPGLDAHAVVKYEAGSISTEKCELKIECNDATIMVPITAYPPSPSFEFDKTKLNFGNILVNSSQIQHFSMKNCGTTEGRFAIECTESDAKVEPKSGVLNPGETVKIAVTLQSVIVGPKQFQIIPRVEGNHDDIPVIEAVGEILCHSVALNGMDDKAVTELDFGYLFHGQKKSLTVKLANNGGIARKFTIDDMAADTEKTIRKSGIFSVSPMTGDLAPYSSVVLTVTYAPPPDFTAEDIEEVHSCVMRANVVETGHVLELSLVGTAVRIGFEVSALDFDFDTVVVKRKTSQILTVTNTSKYLPLPFSMKSVAHFSFVPSSGHIPPEGSQNIALNLFPRNLGPFSYKTAILFCGGIRQREINIDGFVVTDKDGKDFKRAEVWEQSSEAAWYVNHPASKWGLTLKEIQEKKARRKEYDAYISDAAKKRAERATIRKVRKDATIRAKKIIEASKAKFTENDIQEFVQTEIRQRVFDGDDRVNLGLPHCEGMIPPDPPLLRITEPLRSRKFGTNPRCFTAGTETRQKPFDEKVLIQRKFKAKPTTKLEISECSKKLQQDQRLLVIASHQTIDFGTLSVHSSDVRSFQITNNLQFHILVSMNYDCDELKDSTPVSQVVPPHETCGFDIIISSDTPQKFNRPIQYIVNNDLVYSVNVVANIVPINVSLTPDVLVFEFPEDYARPYVKQFVTLENKSTATAEFSWSGFDSVFTNHNLQGSIPPHGKYKAEITYRPDNNPHVESSAVLNVKSGPSRTLKMIGNTGKAKFVLNKKNLAFGLVPLDVPRTMDLRIKNNGPDDGIFQITPNLTDVLVITPASGRVKVGEQTDIHVRVNCLKPGAFEIPVSVAVCGTSPLSFSVTGQAELPRVAMHTDGMDFGLVYVGGSAARSATLENVGCIPAVAFINLTRYPDFHLEYDTKLNTADSEKKNSVALVTDTKSDVSRSGSVTSINSTSAVDAQGATGFIYRFNIIPQSSITFSLVFQPRTADTYQFQLPVSVTSIGVGDEMKPMVKATSLKAPLFLSESSINFGVCPLYDAENPNNRPPLRPLVLKNEYKQDVEFRVGEPSASEFSVEPMTGTVKYATTTTIFIHFRASSAIPFSCVVPVYVTTEHGELLVSEVQLTGIGSYRRFAPSTSYLSLPVVPLGIKSERTIRILNTGSIRAELKTDMPIIEKQFPLSVQFVEGNLFDFSTRYLPLRVSFCSQKPMSLTTIVAIVDDQGNTASFTVSAATDNSIFTLYPILSMRSYKISSCQGKPVMASLSPGELETELLAHVTACDDFINLKPTGKTVSQQLTNLLVRFLNSVIVSTKITRFPEDIAASGGEIVMDIISSLSGKGKVNVIQSPSKGTKKVTEMKSFLQFLKTQGAILPNLVPEFLLPKKDFLDVMRTRIMNQLLGLDYYGAPDMSSYGHVVDDYIASPAFTKALVPRLKVIDDLFKSISTEAWTQVILQVLKLYLFSKIDSDKLVQVPGVNNALDVIKPLVDNVMFAEINRPPKALTGSNIFSGPECALLKWATIHYCATHGGYSDIVNDFTQLRNPKYFLSLLKAHMTRCNLEMVEDAQTTEDFQTNVSSIMTGLKEANVGFIPTAMEITQGSHIGLALILHQLFETLPHFIPSTDIVFNVRLSSYEVQRISVTNPSTKSQITYSASLEGSSNFRIITETVVLEPSQTVDIEVEYFGRTYKSEQAVLTLTPEKPKVVEPKEQRPVTAPVRRTLQRGKPEPVVNASPVVINLTSNVTVNAPLQIVNVEGPIYQTTKMSFTVKNAAKVSGKFDVIPLFVDVSRDRKNVPSLLRHFLENPLAAKQYPEQPTLYESMLLKHQHFLFVQKTVVFEEADSTAKVDFEFIPISLGEFHCFVLFYNENLGEFVYEVVGESVLPQPQKITLNAKTESGKKQHERIPIDAVNKSLFQAVGYALTREAAIETYMSDAKFQDTIAFHVRELQNLYTNAMTSLDFQVENTAPEYFKTPEKFTLTKALGDSPSKYQNLLPIKFAPPTAGEYPCKVVMQSKYDVRIFAFTAICIAATKHLSLEMTTTSGKSITQTVPYMNPSEQMWHFKVSLKGDDCFSAPQTFSAAPNSTGVLTVSMKAGKIGKYSAEMTVVNLDKETTYKYTLSGEVTDPSAEAKILVECRAREKHTQVLDITPVISSGVLEVKSTVPLLTCPKTVTVTNGQLEEPFEVSVYAAHSGISTGTITFTDRETSAYTWYVVDLHVEPPIPEEVLLVNTVCRKTVTVNIPVSNQKDFPVNIEVMLDDPELYGEKQFTIGPKETKTYSIVFSPLVVSKRQSTVAFLNSEEGEFLYILDITVEEPDACVMSQMVAPIGKYSTTLVLLENPVDREVTMSVSNDNPDSFRVVTEDNSVTLAPLEKRQVEIRYIPSSVGSQETCTIGFKSTEVGDWYYKLTGVGKPPVPLSPVIVESLIELSTSGQIIFTNPFPKTTRYEVVLSTEDRRVFQLLNKRRNFVLSQYGEQYQIAFSFSPTSVAQYHATLVVTTIGLSPEVRWCFPVIGNTVLGSENEIPPLKGKTGQKVLHKMEFPLVGEQEQFLDSDYVVKIEYPSGSEWMKSALTVKGVAIERNDPTPKMTVTLECLARKPISNTLSLIIENPMDQKWKFSFRVQIARSGTMKTMIVESPLNCLARYPIIIDAPIHQKTPFTADFAPGSSEELQLSADQGVLEVSLQPHNVLPVEILFTPTTYGKQMRGVLVIETIDAEYMIEVIGRFPSYMPPIVTKSGKIDTTRPDSARRITSARRRNYIKDNIEKAKLSRPQTVRSSRAPFRC